MNIGIGSDRKKGLVDLQTAACSGDRRPFGDDGLLASKSKSRVRLVCDSFVVVFLLENW